MAGRNWARGDFDAAVTDEAAEDAALWGLNLNPAARPISDDDGLWLEHVPALQAFFAVAGQWRTSVLPNGRMIWGGLDYGAARAGLDLAEITVTPEIWQAVRLIESGARNELNG